jgi:transketolase
LRDRTSQDSKKFAHLAEQAKTRELTPVKKKKSGESWQEKIEKMRETHPNAYRPWTNEQDALLKQEFQNGVALEELSVRLGRHERSVLMRLQKHFGEDIVVG